MVSFALYEAPTGGTALFAETLNVTVSNGLFTAYLGRDISNEIDLLTLPTDGLYLGLAVGADPEMTPRFFVASTMYSAFAEFCGDALTLNNKSDADFAESSHGHDFTELTNVPTGLADGDQDTTYTGANGIEVNGTVISADTSLQRVVSPCMPGTSIRSIAPNGSVMCETDDNTVYTGSNGITVNGTLISADTTLQRRVSACMPGTAIREIDASGSVMCEPDNDTTYSAGTGVTISGTTVSVTNYANLAVKNGSMNQSFDGSTLHLDYQNNRVGIRTTSPDEELDVFGDVEVTGIYRFSAPRSYTRFVGPSEFRNTAGNFSGGYWTPASNSAAFFYASPKVPVGASITDLTCYYFKSSSSVTIEDFDFDLLSRSLNSTSVSPLITSTNGPISTNSTAVRGFVARPATPPTVSSSQEYIIRVQLDTTTGSLIPSFARFYGCRIGFRVERAGAY